MKCIVDVMQRDFHSDTSTLKCSREMNFINNEQFNAYVELMNKNADKNRYYVANKMENSSVLQFVDLV